MGTLLHPIIYKSLENIHLMGLRSKQSAITVSESREVIEGLITDRGLSGMCRGAGAVKIPRLLKSNTEVQHTGPSGPRGIYNPRCGGKLDSSTLDFQSLSLTLQDVAYHTQGNEYFKCCSTTYKYVHFSRVNKNIYSTEATLSCLVYICQFSF